MPSPEPLRVTLIGAGAVGGVIAAGLRDALGASLRLNVVARGATLRSLQQQGLQFQDADAPARRVALDAVVDSADIDAVRALGPQDLIVIAVKGPALASVAPVAGALLGPASRALVAMNGVPWWFFDQLDGACRGLKLASVDKGDVIRSHLPTAQVIGAVVHFSSTQPAPGVARRVSGRGLILGSPGGAADTAQVDRWAGLLSKAGFELTQSHCIQRDIWFKLWGNMTMNPVSALTGAACDRVLDDELVRGFLTRVMAEAREIGARFGIPIEQDPQARHLVTRKLGAFRTSMLQDLEAGRPLEIDALIGAVHEIGGHLSVPMPNIEALFGLVRLMARTRGLY
jgi:2-dehydropantoate 2-reductase